jgi:ribose transport system substrate-binding protein
MPGKKLTTLAVASAMAALLVVAACAPAAAPAPTAAPTKPAAPAATVPAAAPTTVAPAPTTAAAAPTSAPAAAAGKALTLDFFAASSQNGFNAAVYQGMQQQATKMGNIQTKIFDGNFDSATQYNQVETLAAAKNADGAVIVPNDNVGIAPAVQDVINAGPKMASALFPIGPDASTLAPQVKGLTATAAYLPAPGAKLQAQEVVKFCQDKNPCRVVAVVGQLQFPFDKLRYDTWMSVLSPNKNIQVVATAEGNYDRNQSLTRMTDVLQAHPQIEVILSNADQEVEGAVIALQNKGYDLKTLVGQGKLYIIGQGATQEAVQAVRDGLWNATYANYPVTMGALATEQLVNALRGAAFKQEIDMDQAGPLPAILTKQVLDSHPEFKGEWSG